MTGDDVFWGMTLAAAELLRRGVTTTVEMYFFEDAVADAVMAAGSRAVITPAVIPLVPPGDDVTSRDVWWAKRLDEVIDFHARRHGEGGRLEVGFRASRRLHRAAADPGRRGRRCPTARCHLPPARGRDRGRGGELRRPSRGDRCPRRWPTSGRSTAGSSPPTASGCRTPTSRSTGATTSPSPTARGATPSWRRGWRRSPGCWTRGSGSGWGPTARLPTTAWTCGRRCALPPWWPASTTGTPAAMPAASALDLATRNGGAGARPSRPRCAGSRGPEPTWCWSTWRTRCSGPLHQDAQLVEHLVWSGSSRLVTDVWVAGRQVVADGECLTVDVDEARRQVDTRSPPAAGRLTGLRSQASCPSANRQTLRANPRRRRRRTTHTTAPVPGTLGLNSADQVRVVPPRFGVMMTSAR